MQALLGLLALVGLYLYFQPKQRKKRGRSKSPGRKTPRIDGYTSPKVVAKNSGNAALKAELMAHADPNSPFTCAKAQACNGKTWLANKAPELPLRGCSAEKCSCTYLYE